MQRTTKDLESGGPTTSGSVVITGGASGLGLATARRAAATGAPVVIADLPGSPGEEVAREIGVAFVPADVTDRHALEVAFDVAQRAAPVRSVIHCAGRRGDQRRVLTSQGGPSELESFQEVVRVNLGGTYNLTTLAASRMVRNEPVQGERGSIVLTASVAAFDGQVGQTAYAAAKAGVHGMTLVLARDLASWGIRVNDRARRVRDPDGGRVGRRGPRGPDCRRALSAAARGARRVRCPRDASPRQPLSERRHRSAGRSSPTAAPVTAAASGVGPARSRRSGGTGATPTRPRPGVDMGRVEGKVALVTGAARGQGRAAAVRLAEEGADLVLFDVCAAPAEIDYQAASREELADTTHRVTALRREALSVVVDVRDALAVEVALARAVARLGRLDVVVANAGIVSWGRFWEMPLEQWQDMIDIKLSGVFHTLRAAAPLMIDAGHGGSIIATSSVAGVKALPGAAHYSAANHGIVGLVKAAALELAPYAIRVNSIHPWGVSSPMGEPGPQARRLRAENPSYEASYGQALFDPPISSPRDIANAVLFLASDEARTITGEQIAIDHGASKV